ncbi:MAG: ribosome assembly cofactor RimP [Bacteroidetes bacterium]|nr:MAG: ribosome assembly cofactor RimP [Bacteroidota bacterium]
MMAPEEIRSKLQDFLDEKNLFIVDIHISPKNEIEIIIDGDNYVSINDCIEVSRYVEGFLNRDIEDFSLTVSSPDATQPLKTIRQYPKHVGKNILIHTTDNNEIKGKIISVSGEELTILTKNKDPNNKKKTIEQEIKVPFSIIQKARILLPY